MLQQFSREGLQSLTNQWLAHVLEIHYSVPHFFITSVEIIWTRITLYHNLVLYMCTWSQLLTDFEGSILGIQEVKWLWELRIENWESSWLWPYLGRRLRRVSVEEAKKSRQTVCGGRALHSRAQRDKQPNELEQQKTREARGEPRSAYSQPASADHGPKQGLKQGNSKKINSIIT